MPRSKLIRRTLAVLDSPFASLDHDLRSPAVGVKLIPLRANRRVEVLGGRPAC